MHHRRYQTQKRPSMRAANYPLPTDVLLTEIFPRLPTKSLFRFKCVSKSFESLISCPHLAKLHLGRCHSLSSSECSLIVNFNNGLYTLDMDSLSSSLKNNAIKLQLPNSHSLQLGRYNYNPFGLIGSCNGLLCIRNFSNFYIFNPLIPKCYREIALEYEGGFVVVGSQCYFGGEPFMVERECLGFGYDSAADDYKIVRILDFMSEFPPYREERKAMVYGLGVNSWKSIQNPWSCDGFIAYYPVGVLIVYSLLHWIFSRVNGFSTEHCIGCFDVNNEQVTNDLPLPDDCADMQPLYCLHKYNLGVLDGCLCLSAITMDDDYYYPSTKVHLWIMKEYGVKESWVKIASISYGTCLSYIDIPLVTPIAYSLGSKHEVLLYEKRDIVQSTSRFARCVGHQFYLRLYDLDSNGKTRLAEICGRGLGISNETTTSLQFVGLFSHFHRVCLHKPSLVTISSGGK